MKTSPPPLPIGKIFGLTLSLVPSSVFGVTILMALLFSLWFWWVDFSFGTALLAAGLSVVLHYFSELVHQLGHAWAAYRSGYPMQGVRFWFIFGTSVYPTSEPKVPAIIHIRRALGGPGFSFVLALFAAGLAQWLRATGGLPYSLALFLLWDNLLVFSLGAMLPLGFTDGSTLLHWLTSQKEPQTKKKTRKAKR